MIEWMMNVPSVSTKEVGGSIFGKSQKTGFEYLMMVAENLWVGMEAPLLEMLNYCHDMNHTA